MNITAKELSGLHVGKRISFYDRTADQFVEGNLMKFEPSKHRVEIWIARDAVPTYADPAQEVVIQEGQ